MIHCDRMNETTNAFLKRAREIIVERTSPEIEYDNTVIAGLAKGMNIQAAIVTANQKHPDEALKPKPDQWADLAVRYEYILQYDKILKGAETI
jgi:hypothetical protein